MNQESIKNKISVVVPVYLASGCLSELYERLLKTISKLGVDFEIVLVNDSSPDNSWGEIKTLALKDNRVIGINFSRNFGQHYAISAGLDSAVGEWIVVMDCDLQDQPEEIEKLYNKALEGYDIVFGRRHERQDYFLKKIVSKLFYAVLSYLTGTKQDSAVANFGIYNKKVILAVNSMHDSIRFFPTLIKWVGFKNVAVEVEHASRVVGKTSYNFRRLINLGLDVMLSFSDRPLKLAVKIGLIISSLPIIFGVVILIKYLQGDILVSGWASLILSIWFLSGLIIVILGIIGLYIGKIFEKVKDRPIYIISEKIN